MKMSKKLIKASLVNDVLRKKFIPEVEIIKRNTDKTLKYVESR